MASKKGGLGKGLDLIFQENTLENNNAITLKINDIEPNREQPRREFDQKALQELADSILKHGVIQPILVRPTVNGSYQIVAGERRWRASRMAGITEIPVLIKEINDSEYMQIALIENLQRENLNPLEEAEAFLVLMKEHNFTQEQVAEAVGKSRPAIANSLRLLALPEEVRKMLADNLLSSGHARTILGFASQDEMVKMAKYTVEHSLNVRQLEQLLKNSQKEPKVTKEKRKNVYYSETELALNTHLGRKVKVDGTNKKGLLQIEFYGEDDLKELIKMLNMK